MHFLYRKNSSEKSFKKHYKLIISTKKKTKDFDFELKNITTIVTYKAINKKEEQTNHTSKTRVR